MEKMKTDDTLVAAPIFFIFCYARSGGTLLNRCLSNIDNLIVLSEVHPINDVVDRGTPSVSVAWQVKKWYDINLHGTGYLEQIRELKEWCDNHGKYLVVRDWSFIDFTPNPLNNYQPSRKPSGFILLEKNFCVKSVAFVRDGVDVALSQGNSIKVFADAYLDYINFLVNQQVEIFKYESFCDNPDVTFRSIGESLEIPDSSSWVFLVDSDRVIGDTNISRGNMKSTVFKIKRKYILPFLRSEIDGSEGISHANRLLGYPIGYESTERDSILETFTFWISKKVKKVGVMMKFKDGVLG